MLPNGIPQGSVQQQDHEKCENISPNPYSSRHCGRYIASRAVSEARVSFSVEVAGHGAVSESSSGHGRRPAHHTPPEASTLAQSPERKRSKSSESARERATEQWAGCRHSIQHIVALVNAPPRPVHEICIGCSKCSGSAIVLLLSVLPSSACEFEQAWTMWWCSACTTRMKLSAGGPANSSHTTWFLGKSSHNES